MVLFVTSYRVMYRQYRNQEAAFVYEGFQRASSRHLSRSGDNLERRTATSMNSSPGLRCSSGMPRMAERPTAEQSRPNRRFASERPAAVAEAVRTIVRVSPTTPAFQEVLIALLSRPGRILCDQQPAK